MAGLPLPLRMSGLAALALAYIVLAHYTLVRPQTANLGLLVALTPIALMTFSIAWHAERRGAMLCLFALAGAGVALAWRWLQHRYSMVYWIEHAGTELMLGLMFARTLQAGREPICSRFARMVHGSLTPEIARYTRQVTKAWVAFFAGMALVSTLLFFVASRESWSLFANFCTAPLIALMFIVEYAVRRLLHPGMQHAHIMDGVKAFWSETAR